MDNEAAAAIRRGDVTALESFLRQNPSAVNMRPDGQRTLLHVATDWPGHFPNVRQTIQLLSDRGADLNAPFLGKHAETPLHWAASADDLEAIDALLDLGAEIESPGSVIDGGPPLTDAVVFGCWRAAHRLVERGARSELWQSAALGQISRIQEFFDCETKPDPQEVTNAFWNACRGGHLEAARDLLAHGADLNWIGHDHLTPLDTAVQNAREDVAAWLRLQGAASKAQPGI